MSQSANASLPGWRVALGRPRAVLLEIAWRWVFGLLALAILSIAAERLLAAVAITPGDIAGLRSHDSILMVGAMLHIWEHAGSAILATAWTVGIALSLLWLGLAAAGRAVTLRALLLHPYAHNPVLTADGIEAVHGAVTRPNHAGVLATTFLRVVLTWLAVFLFLALIGGSAYAAAAAGASPEAPNLALYFLLLAIGLPLLLFGWGVANWYLSLAPVYCVAEGAPAHAAIRLALDAVRMRRAAFFGASAVYGFLRLAGFILLVVAAAIAAAAVPSVIAATVIVALLSLAYFAVADFLYIARLAAYLILLLQPRAAIAPACATPAMEPTGAGFSPELGGN